MEVAGGCCRGCVAGFYRWRYLLPPLQLAVMAFRIAPWGKVLGSLYPFFRRSRNVRWGSCGCRGLPTPHHFPILQWFSGSARQPPKQQPFRSLHLKPPSRLCSQALQILKRRLASSKVPCLLLPCCNPETPSTTPDLVRPFVAGFEEPTFQCNTGRIDLANHS